MKTETFIKRIIEVIQSGKPTTIRFNGKTFHISKKIINTYKDAIINPLDDKLVRNVDTQHTGGILPLLPLIFGGIAAAGGLASASAGIAKAVNDKKAAEKEISETQRHNKEMEKLVKGSGFSDIIGTIKDFGKNFSKETRKSVKDALYTLADKVQIEKQGEGLFLQPHKA